MSLASLDRDLRSRGGGLWSLDGPAPQAIAGFAQELGADTVWCTRDWTPSGLAEESEVQAALQDAGIELHVAEGSLLVTPDSMTTTDGRPYRVFTPFHRAWEHQWHTCNPEPPPERIQSPGAVPPFEAPAASGGTPAIAKHWEPGEQGALRRLKTFVDRALAAYDQERDIPSVEGTSRLSPSLAAGEISPCQVVTAIMAHAMASEATRVFLRQLAWRDFAYHILHHAPGLPNEPWRDEFIAMPWIDDEHALESWRAGRTGFPLVDAGMRELAETGWMHNRVRLTAGSVLSKDVLVHWQDGEKWFWDGLVDADLAVNAFNWQWVAGSGADAAPYFRVFNPVRQGERLDPDGTYVRRWVPELEGVSPKWIHRPWDAPTSDLAAAGVTLGKEYPYPIVDHLEARKRALAAYQHVRESRSGGA